MKDAAVLSKKHEFKFEKRHPGKEIAEEMARVLGNLGGRLNYKGKIMGHLKAMAVAGDNYIQMSVTSLPDVDLKAGLGWYDKEYDNLEITVNIIIFGFTKVQLENMLQESMTGSIFSEK